MSKILSILLVICLVFLGISVSMTKDYAQQITDLSDELDVVRGESYDEGYKNGYDVGYEDGHDDGYNTGRYNRIMANVSKNQNRKILADPASGTIVSGKAYSGSTLTIKSDTESSCVVCLKTASGEERVAFFIRAGDSVTVNVPAEKLYAYFAYGSFWYGYGEGLMFGDETAYSRDDEILDFTKYVYTYTLYPTYNGNYTETPSDEDEFFG